MDRHKTEKIDPVVHVQYQRGIFGKEFQCNFTLHKRIDSDDDDDDDEGSHSIHSLFFNSSTVV